MPAPRTAAVAPALPRAVVLAGVVVGVAAVSTSAILVRVADAPALSLAFWRCLGGAAALAPFALRAQRRGVRIGRDARRRIGWSGALLALHFALWISSLSLTTVASSVVLVTTTPLFVGAGAALLLAEPPPPRTWLGMVVALLGAVVVAGGDLSAAGGGLAAVGGAALLGDAMALAGAVAVAGYLLIGRATRRHLPVTVYAVRVYGVAAAVLLPVCLATGSRLTGYDAATWLVIAGIVVGPQLLGHTVFNALLSTVSATVIATATLAEPIGATALAWLLLDELPARAFWAGAPLILLGVWLASRRPA